MPTTRATTNLKETSIQDHLLKREKDSKLVMNTTVPTNISELNQTGMNSIVNTHNAVTTAAIDDNGNTLTKPVSDYSDLTLTTTNNKTTTSSQQVDLPSQHQVIGIPTFAAEPMEDAGVWIDQVIHFMEQHKIKPIEQRDLVASKLRGQALLWYRMNRLQIPDMQSFIYQFLTAYNASQSSIHVVSPKSTGNQPTQTTFEAATSEQPMNYLHIDKSKLFIEQCPNSELATRDESSWKVLQSAKNEKVKLIPNFSGAENSANWLKSLEQTAKALRLNDQQLLELATIKLSGPAQEWNYHQDDNIPDWSSFKQVFLRAFPPPIQQTNIDYLAQLLSRKQGENEPVGKFVQDINRLCLKLGTKVSEEDQLQYLRRGLRPQLQHHALAISSLQDFLVIMQHHEQIEKDRVTKNPSFSSFRVLSNPSLNHRNTNYPLQNDTSKLEQQRHSQPALGTYSNDYFYQNEHQATPKQQHSQNNNYRVCYQCNKPGHYQRNCPDNNQGSSYDHQHFHQRSH